LLIVEQYVTKALDLADLVYVLQKGRVAFAGEPAELDADALARSYLGGADPAGIAIATSGGLLARLDPPPVGRRLEGCPSLR